METTSWIFQLQISESWSWLRAKTCPILLCNAVEPQRIFFVWFFFSDEGSCWLSWTKGSYKNVHHMFWLLKIVVFFLIGRLVVNRCKETFLVFLVTLNLLKKKLGKWAACQKTDLAREERFLFLWWTVQNGRYDLCRLDRLYRNDQKISDEVRRLDCKGFKAKIVTG